MVLQLVVVVRLRGEQVREKRRQPAVIIVFGKIPQQRVDLRTCPADRVAFVEHAVEGAVMVDGVKLIPFIGLGPHTGVNDDLPAVVNLGFIGDADLDRGVGHEIFVFQNFRRFGKREEFINRKPVLAGETAAGSPVRQTQRGVAVCDPDLALILSGPDRDLEQTGVVRFVQKTQGVPADAQIFCAVADLRGDLVPVVFFQPEREQVHVAADLDHGQFAFVQRVCSGGNGVGGKRMAVVPDISSQDVYRVFRQSGVLVALCRKRVGLAVQVQKVLFRREGEIR